MNELDEIFPPALKRFRYWPLSRDQVMLLLVTINLLFLSLDTYIAHHESGTLVSRELIPIVFGIVGGAMLLFAGLIVGRNRPVATFIATLTLLASIVVGLMGAYFHVMRAALPAAPAGQRLTVDLLIWAPPVLGPLAFVVAAILGISAAWIEKPTGSGTLVLTKRRRIHLPFSKTRAYFFTVGMGMLAALVSSVLDHARTGFESPWVWYVTAVGTFAAVAAVAMGSVEKPSRVDVVVYITAMVILIVSGPIGTMIHVQANLVGESTFVLERFLRGAPFLAPLLYTNMGLLGLVVLLDPEESG